MNSYAQLKFDMYNANNKVGRIELDGNTLVKNESYFNVSKEPFPFMVNLFIRMKDGFSVRKFLATRVVPKERANLKVILDDMGLSEYNIYKILEITHG